MSEQKVTHFDNSSLPVAFKLALSTNTVVIPLKKENNEALLVLTKKDGTYRLTCKDSSVTISPEVLTAIKKKSDLIFPELKKKWIVSDVAVVM